MTGKEKIQFVTELIFDEYEKLVSGNQVSIYSAQLDNKGIYQEEQLQILDILTDKEKLIKYEPAVIYESESDIDYETILHIKEESLMDGMMERRMIENLLDSREYRITVLDKLRKIAEKKAEEDDAQRRVNLYCLELAYHRVMTMLDAIVGYGILVESEETDDVYIRLNLFIEKTLNLLQISELRQKAPELYPTLIGQSEKIGDGWQYDKADVAKFYGAIKKLRLADSTGPVELPKEFENFIDEVDKTIVKHEGMTITAAKKRDEIRAWKKAKLQAEQRVEPKKTNEKNEASIPPNSIKVHRLEPNHYVNSKGTLYLSPTVKAQIAKKGGVKRKDGTKYDQCRLMDCLFTSVNTLKNGVKISKVLGVHPDKIGKKEEKKIRNAIDEIHSKTSLVGGPDKLIKIQKQKVFVNSSYL